MQCTHVFGAAPAHRAAGCDARQAGRRGCSGSRPLLRRAAASCGRRPAARRAASACARLRRARALLLLLLSQQQARVRRSALRRGVLLPRKVALREPVGHARRHLHHARVAVHNPARAAWRELRRAMGVWAARCAQRA
jgi:hypothetical protein